MFRVQSNPTYDIIDLKWAKPPIIPDDQSRPMGLKRAKQRTFPFLFLYNDHDHFLSVRSDWISRVLQVGCAAAQGTKKMVTSMIIPNTISYLLIIDFKLFVLNWICDIKQFCTQFCCLCAVFDSRRTRPSWSRRSWPRRCGRTAPSPIGFVWGLITLLGIFASCFFFYINIKSLCDFDLLVKWCHGSDWCCLCRRYNAKRRHWRRTKLGF